MNNKYEPNIGKVKPWDNIEKIFNELFEGQYRTNIAELVRHIKTTGLSNRLYGMTSMDTLIIGIYDPIERDRETLHVTFNTDNNLWKFIYYAMPFRRPEFVRQYPTEKGIEKFDIFIKSIAW